jgi:hypothetical protein
MPAKTEIKPVTEFTIVRRRWRRGKQIEGKGSYLRNEKDGKMCCLGFYLEACGVPRAEINGRGMPYQVLNNALDQKKKVAVLKQLRVAGARWLVILRGHSAGVPASYDNDEITEDLVDANDNKKLSSAKIEEKVAALFAKKGVKVRFK